MAKALGFISRWKIYLNINFLYQSNLEKNQLNHAKINQKNELSAISKNINQKFTSYKNSWYKGGVFYEETVPPQKIILEKPIG